ncbi:VCBS repeat-containing protein [Pyxidicoccus parkwayensis]|uniref:VCBS repeat-containing protein n=1 Tax=Pyxidicoccus parkwayensis TaxID=2813578 RepID=A0ABX7NUS7_9BACT|nr:FG-GAP-like repeat-containing protein [Pyxidicoccus parkwaysis]QSQ21250.1 VCBS repeat-containing protein [Pyxidicoccus parkwaysis]
MSKLPRSLRWLVSGLVGLTLLTACGSQDEPPGDTGASTALYLDPSAGSAQQAVSQCEEGKVPCYCGPGCSPEFTCLPVSHEQEGVCTAFCTDACRGGPDGGTTPSKTPVCPDAKEGFPFPADLPAPSPAKVGALPASFEVSSSGDAEYSIPLVVPPGRAGMQPNLAVSFNSSRGLGLFGKGFELVGLGSVERCGSTLAQDGVVRGVAFDTSDHFCLDGLRLAPVGPPGVDPNSSDTVVEYRTVPDSFRKVVAHYLLGADMAAGPTSFVVHLPSGIISTYGMRTVLAGRGTTPVRGSWLLSEVADRRGNTVRYTYDTAADVYGNTIEVWPYSIAYTGHKTLSADKMVLFDYQPLTRSVGTLTAPMLQQSGFRGGNRFRRSKLITGIRMLLANNPYYREYRFTYHASNSTGWPLLDTMEECASGVCKPATRLTWDDHGFQWQDHGYPQFVESSGIPQMPISEACSLLPEVVDGPASAPDVPRWTSKTLSQWTLADVNGDGFADLVSSTGAGCDSSANATVNVWRVSLNRGNGSFTPWKEWARMPFPYDPSGGEVPATDFYYQLTPVDVNQDGNMDLMVYRQNGVFAPSHNYRYLRSVPPTQWDAQGNPIDGSFTLVDTGIPQPTFDASFKENHIPYDFHHVVRFGDVNGDAVADLIECTDPLPFNSSTTEDTSTWRVYLWSPTAAGGAPGYSSSLVSTPPWTFSCAAARALVHVVDIDGDGKQEVLARWDDSPPPNTTVYHSSPGAFGAWSFNPGTGWTVRATNLPIPIAQYLSPVWMDVNGDGYVDYVYPWGMEMYFHDPQQTSDPALMGMPAYPGVGATWDPTQWANNDARPDVPWVNLNLGNGSFSGASEAIGTSAAFVNKYNDPTHHPWTITGFSSTVQIDHNGDGIMDLMIPAPGAVSTGNLECQGCVDVACLYCTIGINVASIARPPSQYQLSPGAPNVTLSQFWAIYSGVAGGRSGSPALPDLDEVLTTNLNRPDPTWDPVFYPGPHQYNNAFFTPQVGDINGDGRDDFVMPRQDFTFSDRTNYGKMSWWRNDVGRDRLVAITDGANVHDPASPNFKPSIRIEYGTLTDKSIMGKAAAPTAEQVDQQLYLSRSDASNGCVYPRRCVVGPRSVVSGYTVADGSGGTRSYQLRYRDGRYDLHGRGWLGFGELITTETATGVGTAKLFDNVTLGASKTYPFAGRVKEVISWAPNGPSHPKPKQVMLSYRLDTPNEVVHLPGVSHHVMTLRSRTISAEGSFASPNWPGGYHRFARLEDPFAGASSLAILSDSTWTAQSWDALWGTVTSSVRSTQGVDEVDVTTTHYNNDAPSWVIHRPNFTQTCSTSLGLTHCPKRSIGYTPFGEVEDITTGDASGDSQLVLTTRLERDEFGNVTGESSEDLFGNKRAVCVSYDESATYPYATSNLLGHVVRTRFNPSLGNLMAVVDQNQLVTQWQYDVFGRQITERRPDGTTTSTTYGRVQTPTTNLWNSTITTQLAGGDWRMVRLDGAGRPVLMSTTGAQVSSCNGSNCTTTPRYSIDLEYDTLGRQLRKSLPYLDGDPAWMKKYVQYTYDGSGRMLTAQAPWNTVTFEYAGLTEARTDSNGPVPQAKTQVVYDALGRVDKVVPPINGAEASYTYGPFGAVWRVDHAGDITTTARDPLQRIREVVDPNRGATRLEYNGFGEQTRAEDALNRVFKTTYDVLGRRQARKDPDGMTEWLYDTAPLGVGKVARGALAAVISPDGTRSGYAYDKFGRIAEMSQDIGGNVLSAKFAYDSYGRLSALTYPQVPNITPLTIVNTYDAFGHLVSVRDQASSLALWTLESTNGWGAPTVEAFQGKVERHIGYDPNTRRISRLQTGYSSGQFFQDLSYTWDGHFNMRTRADTVSAGTLQVEHFTYDALDRLGCSWIDDVPPKQEGKDGPPDCSSAWVTYLPNGNIQAKWDVGKYTYDSNHANAVIDAGGLGFKYDAVGNQTLRPDASITYTAFDLPASYTSKSSAQVTKFAYDGHQHRIYQTDGKSETTYFGDLYEHRRDPNADKHIFYVTTGTSRVAITREAQTDDEVVYLHPDVLGSTDVVATNAGVVKERRSYDAWGLQRDPVWKNGASGPYSSLHTLGFTSHEGEIALGLVNMKGRIYDPRVGRFLQTDPLVSNPFDPQRWNAYSYVLNNPLKYTDPSGFDNEPSDTVVDTGQVSGTLTSEFDGREENFANNETIVSTTIVTFTRDSDGAAARVAAEPVPASAPAAEDSLAGDNSFDVHSPWSWGNLIFPVVKFNNPGNGSTPGSQFRRWWNGLDEPTRPSSGATLDVAGAARPMSASEVSQHIKWLQDPTIPCRTPGDCLLNMAKAGAQMAPGMAQMPNVITTPIRFPSPGGGSPGRSVTPAPSGGAWAAVTNQAGGRVWGAAAETNGRQVMARVNQLYSAGVRDITVITGVHGTPSGEFVVDQGAFKFYPEDIANLAHLPGVRIVDVVSMTPAQIANTLQSSQGTIVLGMCYGAAVLPIP